MADRQSFTVQVGETHRVRITSPLGSSYTATATAGLHRLRGGINSYSPDSTESAAYTVASYAGDATYGPGWTFTLSDATTATLEPGVYVASPKITYTAPESFVDIPLSWLVEVKYYPS